MKIKLLGAFLILFHIPWFIYTQHKLIIHQVDVSNFPLLKAYVSIIDEKGESVKGLDETNFKLTEDGNGINRVKCASIFPNREWLTIVLALDKSGSMAGQPIIEAKKGAELFIKKVGGQDKVSLVIFDKEVFWKTDFIRDKNSILEEIDLIIPERNTALYDTIIQSLERLKETESPRKALVILTDGKDTESKNSLDECLEKVEGSRVPIYIIGLGKEVNQEIIKRVARLSKGNHFFASTSPELREIYASIASQLENQYILNYNFNGIGEIATHSLVVEAKIASETLNDKIFYSMSTYSTGQETCQEEFLSIKAITVPALIGGVIGFFLFFVLSCFLFKGYRFSPALRFSFIILGTLLFAIFGILIFR